MKKLWNKIRSIKRSTIIKNSFLLPILSVVAMSISHVISWYDLGNPMAWAIYLSVAVEIFALASVSAASLKMKKRSIWLLFGMVTAIQIIGNVFFTYKDIDPNGDGFKSWVELIQPWFEDWDVTDHKRFLAYIQGGTLPFMSLIALHFYIKFNENLSDEEKELSNKTDDYFTARNNHIEQLMKQREDDLKRHAADAPEMPSMENVEVIDDKEEILEGPTGNNGPSDEGLGNVTQEEMIPDIAVKNALKEQQNAGEEIKSDDIVQKVTQKTNDLNEGQIYGHRRKENPGQNPQIMPGIN